VGSGTDLRTDLRGAFGIVVEVEVSWFRNWGSKSKKSFEVVGGEERKSEEGEGYLWPKGGFSLNGCSDISRLLFTLLCHSDCGLGHNVSLGL
jgi:hypothetical protein